MLRFNDTMSAAGAFGYLAAGIGSYHFEGQEGPLYWGGELTRRWGLTGLVEREPFYNLCHRCHPQTGEFLGQRKNDRFRAGMDITANVPKAVTLAALEDPEIYDDIWAANGVMMDAVEADAKTRVRLRGADGDRHTGNIGYASGMHFTARQIDGWSDPHAHIHNFVFNLTHDGVEDRTKAVQLGDVKRDGPYYQGIFLNELATRMRARGHGIRRTAKDFTLVGVSDELVRTFSRRTAQIEQTAAELDIRNPDSKGKLGATTRESKHHDKTMAELREHWFSRMTAEQRAELKNLKGRPSWNVTADEAMAHAIAHCFEPSSTVAERKILAEALRYGVGSVTLEALEEAAHRQGVFTRDVDGQTIASTLGVLREEASMADFARLGRGTMKQVGRVRAFASPSHGAGERPHPDGLSGDQVAAIDRILSSTDRVIVIEADQGTGKTELQRHLAPLLPKATFLGTTSGAAEELAARVGQDQTVAAFLLNDKAQERARGGWVVVDEAGMLGHKDAARLFALAEEKNLRLVFVGDSKQHKSVPRGNLLVLLREQAGIEPIRMRQTKRQTGEYRAAMEMLAAGNVAQGFARLDARGDVREGTHADVVAEYMQAVGSGDTALIVSPTHADGARLTEIVREELKRAGRIQGEERAFTRLVPLNYTEAQRADDTQYDAGYVAQFVRNAGDYRAGQRVQVGMGAAGVSRLSRLAGHHNLYTQDSVLLAPGDVVRITAGGRDVTGKHRLRTGQQYTVAGFTEAGGVRLHNGWVLAQDFGHLAHGYVSTSHAAQGKTVNRVIVSMPAATFPAVTRETLYVASSRGRQGVTIFTDDKEALEEAVRREDRRLLAHDLADYPLSRRRKRLQRGAYLRRLARTHDKAPPIPYKQEPKLAQERLDAAERAHRFRNAIAPRPAGPGEQRGYSR